MYELDRFEHSTVVAAVIHYALHVFDPSECIRALNTLCPDPGVPWDELIGDSRDKLIRMTEVAAMQEP